MAKRFDKDPSAVLDYGLDWGLWLQYQETISTSTWDVEIYRNKNNIPSPDLLTVDSTSKTDTTTTVWLSDGVDDITYIVTNHVVTSQGREDDRSFLIDVVER